MKNLEANQAEASLSLFGAVWENTASHIGFTIDEKPFFPMIFDGNDGDEDFQQFNGVVIPLRAGLKEDLKWDAAYEKAVNAVNRGQCILWELDLGFSRADLPLSDAGQYLSFQIALDHFRDTLWKEFSGHTLGLVLFKGPADLCDVFIWDEQQLSRFNEWLQDSFQEVALLNAEIEGEWKSLGEVQPQSLRGHSKGMRILRLFCADLFADYMNLLSSSLPAEVQLFLMLDCSMIGSLAERLQLISLERFSRYHLILRGDCYQFPCLAWGEGDTQIGRVGANPLPMQKPSEKRVAVLLPSSEVFSFQPFEKTANSIHQLHQQNVPVRLIPEAFLTTQWDGVDFIVVEPSGVTSVGKRMLQGFCAAGGTVINVDSSLAKF